MTVTVWPERFSLVLPIDWIYSESEGTISCYDPENGVGVLQVSLFERASVGIVTEREVRDLAVRFGENRKWDLSLPDLSVEISDRGFMAKFEFYDTLTTDDFWYVVHFLTAERMALVTYTCELEDVTVETGVVKDILTTFAWKPIDDKHG